MTSDAEKLWDEIATNSFVMELAESITPYLKENQIIRGNPVRYLSVKTVRFTGKEIVGVFHLDVDIEVLSDEGDWVEHVIFRIHQNPEAYKLEKKLHLLLEERTSTHKDIYVTPLLAEFPQKLLFVYVNYGTESILNLDYILVDFSLGRVAAIMHGLESKKLASKDILNTLKLMLQYLPFDPKTKQEFEKSLTNDLKSKKKILGGYVPCTTFSPKMIKIKPKLSIEDIDLASCSDGTGFDTYIPMGVVDENIHDRFEDISNNYTEFAIQEFGRNQNLNVTKEKIERFLMGYEIEFQKQGKSLYELYPDGFTLTYQFLIGIWLKLASEIETATEPYIQTIERMSDYLIFSKTFDVINVEGF